MERTTIFLLWYLTGLVSALITDYLIEKEITIRDLLFALFFGLFGAFTLILCLAAIIVELTEIKNFKIKDILEKRII